VDAAGIPLAKVARGALAGWVFSQAARRADKSKCEQEIAEYRALVMQGIPTAAPRCSQ